MHEALVIDVGATKTNVCLVGIENGKVSILKSEKFLTESNPEHEIQKIHNCFFSFKNKPEILSLSLPGKWNSDGVLQESLFLKDWEGYAFVRNLADGLKIEDFFYETDIICGALGEYNAIVETHGNASLLYVNVGTGIGAAFIDNDGKVFKSKSNPTLRLQKLVLPYEDEIYSAVDLISGGTLAQIAKCNSIEELYKAYKKADIEAIDIISKAQIQFASWLINLFYLFAPDVIVLGGGLTFDWEVLAEGAIDIANEELEDQVEILPSKLKEMAPIYGAYLNYNQQVSESTSLQV